MRNRFLKVCSIFLVMVLLFNMLPHRALADMLSGEEPSLTPGSIAAGGLQDLSATEEVTSQMSTDAEPEIVGEVTEKRTEFSKEFRLSNGLHMAVVYPDAVHYETDSGWEEIDNTLITNTDGTVTNTAGVWEVSFPQQLSKDKSITVQKDGYTLSFFMAGELTATSGAVVMAAGLAEESLAVGNMQQATGVIQAVSQETAADDPTVLPKLQSKITYANVYQNTNVVYDLRSNKVKESIVLASYNSALRGYRYTLDVGSMIPVLEEDGQITLYDASRENIVMVMPAPYMIDSAGLQTNDIQVQLTGSGSRYTMTYLLPRQWLAAEDRAWPVILDPVVQPTLSTTNIRDRSVTENWDPSSTWGYNACGYFVPEGIVRFFLKFNDLPALTSSDVIVNAAVQMYKDAGTDTTIPVNVHKVNANWDSATLTWRNKPSYDTNIEDFAMVNADGWYSWNITDIARDWYANENTGMMFKSSDGVESGGVGNYKQFISADYGVDSWLPILSITFRNNNGLEDYWDYTASSAGRAGTGYVNNYTGNLMWTRDIMGFDGNRMPVSISHIYNLNDASENSFGLGAGWRTNYNQRLYQWSLDSSYYIWEDGDGTDHYFKYSSPGVYKDEDGLKLTLTITESDACIADKTGNSSHFDSNGRLTKISNNQQEKSSVNITYIGTSYRISTVTDGAGRVYRFTYTNDLLSSITFEGLTGDSYQSVSFTYDGNKLYKITDADNRSCKYTYTGSGILHTVQNVDSYTLTYTYNSRSQSWQPYRVLSVAESDYDSNMEEWVNGGTQTFTYEHNQTTVTDHDGNTHAIQFNDWGNVTAVYDDEGRAQFSRYTTDTDPNGTPHQLTLSSDLQSTVVNILDNSGFESGNFSSVWTKNSDEMQVNIDGACGYNGSSGLEIYVNYPGVHGVSASAYSLPAGETFTFSAYIKTVSAYAYISLADQSWERLVESVVLAPGAEWTRLKISYTNDTAAAVSIRPQILTYSMEGYFYVDCVQLELSPTASRYNFVDNGDFRYTSAWSSAGGRTTATPAFSRLSPTVYTLSGTYTTENRIQQTISISGKKDDAFVLAGWGKGNSVPFEMFTGGTYRTRDSRAFGLRARFQYGGDEYSPYFGIDFNPSAENWQYAATQITAPADYTAIVVELVYDKGANAVSFDGIQLLEGRIGTEYTYNSYNNLETETDTLGNKTQYLYDNTYDLLESVLEPNGVHTAYVYDTLYYNLLQKTVTAGETVGEEVETIYRYEYDAYGNTISEAVSANGSTMTTSFTYQHNGNCLYGITDPLGNSTYYNHNANTGMLNQAEDDDGSLTQYFYDAMFRIKEIQVRKNIVNLDDVSSVRYTYSGDDLIRISTGTTVYNISYDLYGQPGSITADDISLVIYWYYEDQNRNLSMLDYSDGSGVYYSYDEKGRVIRESDSNGAVVDYIYNNDGTLAIVKDSGSDITTSYYYDDVGRPTRYAETGTGRNHSVNYSYDGLGRLSVLREHVGLSSYTTHYGYDACSRLNSQTTDLTATNSLSVTYYYDNFGRLLNQAHQIEENGQTGPIAVLAKEFTYTDPDTEITSDRVATYEVSSPVGYSSTKYSYEYDVSGNILVVRADASTTGLSFTSYAYDCMNQLIRENNQAGGVTYVWEYDDAGNILSRKEYPYTSHEQDVVGEPLDTVIYTYDGDILTSYDGKAVSGYQWGTYIYDGWTYETVRGNRLVGMYKWDYDANCEVARTFTYDANGMRVKRVEPDGTTYNYVYNGGLLSQMTVDNNTSSVTEYTLFFTYDAAGIPTSVTVNGTTYYYVTNLQGDVVAILDSHGGTVAKYVYDAWGNILDSSFFFRKYDPVTEKYGYNEDTSANAIGRLNPLRYRGYVYDTETGWYYLQSRYYNPEWGRFITADSVDYLGADGTVASYNLFSYCSNNPVMYSDPTGHAIETVFDVISLGASIVEVCINPTDIWAWAGLVGDAVDLVPFVTGVGELTRAAKTTKKVVDGVDNIVDAAKATYKAADAASDIRKATGTYEILYKSGKNYVGKGGFKRAIASATRNVTKYGDEVVSIMWKSNKSTAGAFLEEYALQTIRGVNNASTYNIIWSPGKKLYKALFG